MNRMKHNFEMLLLPLLLFLIINGCSDRLGIVTPPIINSPQVSLTDPLNSSTAVALNQKIAATFSKAMDASTITESTFTLMIGTTPISGFVSYSGITAIFSPTNNLEANTTYTVSITTGAKDPDGNPLLDKYVWGFTTGSDVVVTPPEVSLTDPINAATNVGINQKIAATFTKTMDASTIQATTFELTQGTTPVPSFISYSGTTAILAPSANLAPGTVYTVTITNGVKDLTGNAMVNNYVWTFTTGSTTIVTAPTVSSTDPNNLATGVVLSQKVAATFSKTMDATTITSATFTLAHGSTSVQGFVSYTGVVATFTPAINLLANTLYTATITTGAKDLAGNAIANNYIWTFTTGLAPVITIPTVLSTDPINGETNVVFNKVVKATFSKTMDNSTITTATFTLMQGSTFVAGSISLSGNIAAYTPSRDLMSNTDYTATITTGAKDITGNAIASNYVWTFKTIVTNTISLSSIPAIGGNTTGGGTYNSGTLVTVTATPNAGYSFINWTENGIIISTNANYQFTLTVNRKLAANFVTGPIVPLGGAATFGGFGGSAGLTNQGIFTVVNGDIGTTAASTLVTGFHDGDGNVFTETPLNAGLVTGVINCAPPAPGTAEKFTIAQQALADATTAFNYLAGLPGGTDPGAGELGNLVLAPGTYTAALGTFGITSGDLTLDAKNNPNAVFIFQMAKSLTVGLAGQARSIILVNGAQAKNVFWQVGSAATINGAGGGTMVGTIISYSGVSFSTAGNVILTVLNGRALSLHASVTLVNTIVNVPSAK